MKASIISKVIGLIGIITMCWITSTKVMASDVVEMTLVNGFLPESGVFIKRQFPKKWNGQERKVVYLTFDDGPSKQTEDILSILNDYGVKATFFFIGTNVNRYPEEVKLVHQQGHYVGLHSMSHDKKLIYNPEKPYAFAEELIEEQGLIEALIHVQPTLVRPPYGSVPGIKPTMADALVDHGFKVWDWTIDSEDWKKKSASAIVEQIKSQTTSATEVVLVHEKALTVEALPQIIEHFLQEGYEFRAYNPEQHFMLNFLKDSRL